MNQYTVIQPEWVENQLAELWLKAKDRDAVTAAADLIDRELRNEAESKGEQVNRDLRRFAAGPLWAYYTVHPDDCFVKVWAILPAKS
jgi:hypothetical protein